MFASVWRREAALPAAALLFYGLAAAVALPGDRAAGPRPLYFAPGKVLKRFSFGFAEAAADMLYLRLIQDMDFCGGAGISRAEAAETAWAPAFAGKSSAGKSSAGLAAAAAPRPHRPRAKPPPPAVAPAPLPPGAAEESQSAAKTPRACRLGWSYRMTEAVTELDPRFLGPYLTAASIMSVIVRDREGAAKIYEKGLERFPDNWRVSFHAGYHYIHELKDDERGVRALLRSARSGGPPWLFRLAAKKYREAGKQLLAWQALIAP